MTDFLGGDDWLDSELRNVPLPEHLADDLVRAIQNEATADQLLDERLRDILMPEDLKFRLRRIPHTTPRQSPVWSRVALAASVLVAVTMGYWLWPAWNETPTIQVVKSNAATRRSKITVAPALDNSTAREAESQVSVNETPATMYPAPAAVATSEASRDTSAAKASQPAKPAAVEVFTTFGTRDPLPVFDTVSLSRERGIRPPRAAGFDLAYQLRTGLHPWVMLSASPQLKTQSPPLTTSKESFAAALSELHSSSGEIGSLAEIRADEFLAAMPLGLPTGRNGQPALHVVGAPALGKPGVTILLISAVMPSARPQKLPNAEDPSLTVQWNPAVVLAYRLVGHESSSATSKGESSDITLHPGESVSLLYELQLAPKGDAMGNVELKWKDSLKPREEKPSVASHAVQRQRLAKKVEDTNPALLIAQAATQTAEWLRSPRFAYVPQWDQLCAVCEKLPDNMRSDAATTGLVELMRHIERQGTRVPKAR